ncbi:hypothetical protein CF327_g2068 [Tilletia walkeri]|uniref:Uncharacterized protein n=1 Tax=Tilletia walkeri TaxID=117179 RepID=A0A8X7T6M0_9BASI|nr:hypothetical protein CF327_g2068 [Tilletia walkeri]KAE8270013.1 hypothetical protein A4X09_0g2307 [Tilletia walkeri]
MGNPLRRTFCCCIPTRLAVLILSALTLASAILTAWASLSPVTSDGKSSNNWLNAFKDLSDSSRVVLIFNGTIAIFTGVCSLAGLVGAMLRQRRLVGMYSFAVWGLLVVFMVLGSVSIWAAYGDRPQFERTCKEHLRPDQGQDKGKDNGKDKDKDVCHDAYDVGLAVTCILFAIICLIKTYLCIIVGRYKHQLYAEHAARATSSAPPIIAYKSVRDVQRQATI